MTVSPSRSVARTSDSRGAFARIIVASAGALLGTWATGVLNGSPDQRLLGLFLGALVPALLVEAFARRPHLGAAILVALVSIVLTYLSVTGWNYATESPATFPLPPGAPSTGGSIHEERNGLQIEVSPAELTCTAGDGCAEKVRVDNPGTLSLQLGLIEVEGEYAERFTADPLQECAFHLLPPGESCSFEVLYDSAESGTPETARLVIHQNLPGDPTYLPVAGNGEPGGDAPPAHVNVALGEVRCGTGAADDGLQHLLVVPQVDVTTASAVPDEITVSASLADAWSVGDSRDVGPAPIAVDLGVPVAEAGPHKFVVAVDPGDRIPETNESDNVVSIVC